MSTCFLGLESKAPVIPNNHHIYRVAMLSFPSVATHVIFHSVFQVGAKDNKLETDWRFANFCSINVTICMQTAEDKAVREAGFSAFLRGHAHEFFIKFSALLYKRYISSATLSR